MVAEEARLDDAGDAEGSHPGQLVRAHRAPVFDTVTRVRGGAQLLRLLQGVQGHVDGAVADGVHGRWPARQVTLDDRGLQRLELASGGPTSPSRCVRGGLPSHVLNDDWAALRAGAAGYPGAPGLGIRSGRR